MSYGALVFFDIDGEEVANSPVFQNGWGMGPAVWEVCCSALGARSLFNLGQEKYPGDISGQYQALVEDKLAPEHRPLGTPLLMTLLEPTLVARKDWPAVVAHILKTFKVDTLETFEKRLLTGGKVNHWAKICRELQERQGDENLLGFGIYNTPINDYPFRGPYNEETDGFGPWSPTGNSMWLRPATEEEGARRVTYEELTA